MSAKTMKQRLVDLHAYACLYTALRPSLRGTSGDEVRRALNEIRDYLAKASAHQLISCGPGLCAQLIRSTPDHPQINPILARETIGRSFIELSNEYDVWRYGITHDWLLDRFRQPMFGLPNDLPAHARIGIGSHAGSSSIEESNLLDDAFYFHELTHSANNRMHDERRKFSDELTAEEFAAVHASLTRLNLNVASFARSVVLTTAAFIESFTNSVGSNAAARTCGLAAEVIEQLHGQRKGRYLSLEYKLEKFPALIRSDKQSPLRVLDEAQRQTPVHRFLTQTKDVRDSSMHFGSTKTPIVCPPKEWIERADGAIEDALEVARLFWIACYPTSNGPEYLANFDAQVFRSRARLRM